MKRMIVVLVTAGLMVAFLSVPAAGGRGPGNSLTALSAAEKAGLLSLREEEKLARDVYLTLAGMWDLPIFDNIAVSEQRHMDAVKALLDKYGLADPATGKGIGEFSDPAFTGLYLALVGAGSESLAGALEVGVAIEVMDIDDITKLLAGVTHTDIANVYTNLRAGSQNHLAAFTAQLDALE